MHYIKYTIVVINQKIMGQLLIRQKEFMKTVITVKAVRDNEPTVDILDGIEDAFGEFDRIVKQYTRFSEDSELSNLNRNSGKWVTVSEEFFKLIEYMLNLANITDGSFDPTIIDFLEIYGYNKNYDFSKLENPKLDELVQEKVANRKSFKDIELNSKEREVKLAPAQKIDLGGIGKGYAIDCAYEKLVQKGAKNFLIDAGGDIRAKGKNEKGEYWRVGLKHQDEEQKEVILGEVELKDSSIACSGSWARKVKQFHHLINPKTGKPENSRRTVYVQSDLAIDSDSWATAIFIGGEDVAKKAPSKMKYYLL